MEFNIIYWAVFIINVIYLSKGDVIKGSLTFVIDDTFSMHDDIEGVKEKTNQVFDTVLESRSSQIGDFVLVTFNDPGVLVRTKGRNRDVFKNELAKIEVHGGGDCPELSMAGIMKALEESAPKSELYVFTDASAKDLSRYEEVKGFSQKKSSQVTFLLTGICGKSTDKDYLVYHDLAEATGGEVFHIQKQNVNKIIDYIIEKVKSPTTPLAKKTIYNDDEVHFNVDSTVENITVSAAGIVIQLSILDSGGIEVPTETVVNADLAYVVKFSAKPGSYTIKIKSDGKTSVQVRGSTAISFQHGFSYNRPTSISETSTRPIAGRKSYLSIALTNKARNVKLETSELRDMKDNVVMTIPLKLIDAKQQFYISEPFTAPEDMFKVAINGYTLSKERITRVAAVSVEPQKIVSKDIDQKSPKVSLLTDAEVRVELNMPVILKCKVEAYPKPDIIWENEDGNTFSPKVEILDVPYDYISVLEVKEIDKNATYYCKALNPVGADQKQVNVILSTAVPKIDKKFFFYIKRKGSRTELTCSLLQGYPKPNISWEYRNSPEDKYIPLKGVKETIVFNETQPSHSGSYRCVVQNEVGKDSHEIELMVSYSPVIKKDVDHILASEGESIDIPCHVEGMPLPIVKWLRNNDEINSGSKYNIYRDHTLRFKVTLDDTGSYSCIAKNEFGIAQRIVRLNVYKPVNIYPPKKSTINIMAGSPLNLTCDADGYPKPDLKWTYLSFEPKPIPKVISFKEKANELQLFRKVEDSDSGFYICDASNSDSEASITYTVHVQAPPMIEKGNETLYAVKADLVLRIPCKSHGNPKPIVTWERDDFKLIASSEFHYIDEDGTLVLIKPNPEDSGIYTCVAENEFGQESKIYEITVDSYPQHVDMVSTTVIEEGVMSDIKCDIPHHPTDYLRWYKDGKQINTGELRLDNPKISSAGTYICRVSNYNSSYSYHTVVNVEFKPRFTSDESDEAIKFVEGLSTSLDCSAVGYPNPKVTWTLNGNLIDVSSMTYHIYHMDTNDIGDYQCHVFNDLGYVNRTFHVKVTECLIPLKNFNGNQPLLITPAYTWPTFDIFNGTNENFVSVPSENPVILYCPGNFLNYPALNRRQNIKAKCIQDSLFNVEGKTIKFSDIKCYDEIKPFVKNTKRKCVPSANSELLIVGYIFGRRFLEVYEVCLDKYHKIPLFARHNLGKFISNFLPNDEPKYAETKELPLNFDELYSQQVNTLSSILGRHFETSDSCQFSKRHLVSPRDVCPGSQSATYNYLNVVPHWSCYKQNWEEVEDKVRLLTDQLELIVWTGTSDVMRLPDQPDGSYLYLRDKSYNEQVVPLYLWKVVQNSVLSGSVAIIQINMPNITLSEAYRYVKCRDICNEVEWLRKEDWHDVRKGFTFCCNIIEFQNAFNYKGVFSGPTNVLVVPSIDLVSNSLSIL